MELCCRYCSYTCHYQAELDRHVDNVHHGIARFSGESPSESPFPLSSMKDPSGDLVIGELRHASFKEQISRTPKSLPSYSEPTSADSASWFDDSGTSNDLTFSIGSLPSSTNTTRQSTSVFSPSNAEIFQDPDEDFDMRTSSSGFIHDSDEPEVSLNTDQDVDQFAKRPFNRRAKVSHLNRHGHGDNSFTVARVESGATNFSSNSRCYSCGQMGHTARNCPSSVIASDGRDWNYGGKQSSMRRSAFDMCYVCGKPGHHGPDCPNGTQIPASNIPGAKSSLFSKSQKQARRDSSRVEPRSHPASVDLTGDLIPAENSAVEVSMGHGSPSESTPDQQSVPGKESTGDKEPKSTTLESISSTQHLRVSTLDTKSSAPPSAGRMSEDRAMSESTDIFSEFGQSSTDTQSSAASQHTQDLNYRQLYHWTRSIVGHAVKIFEAFVQRHRVAAAAPSANKEEVSQHRTANNLNYNAGNNRGSTRKLRNHEDAFGNEDEDGEKSDGEGPKRQKLGPPGSKYSLPQQLACFFWKNPSLKLCKSVSKSYKICSTPFRTMKLLKEHCVRVHPAPRHCTRCYVEFQTDKELEYHRDSSPIACVPQPKKRYDAVTEKNRKDIRTETKGIKSDAKRWTIMYKIIFEVVNDEDVPSPFFENTCIDSGHSVDIESLVEAYIHVQLPRRIQELDLDDENVLDKLRALVDVVLREFISLLPDRSTDGAKEPRSTLDAMSMLEGDGAGNQGGSQEGFQLAGLHGGPLDQAVAISNPGITFAHGEGYVDPFRTLNSEQGLNSSYQVSANLTMAHSNSNQPPMMDQSYSFGPLVPLQSMEEILPDTESEDVERPQQLDVPDDGVSPNQSSGEFSNGTTTPAFSTIYSSSGQNNDSYTLQPGISTLNPSSGEIIWGSDMDQLAQNSATSYFKTNDPVLFSTEEDSSSEEEDG